MFTVDHLWAGYWRHLRAHLVVTPVMLLLWPSHPWRELLADL